MELTQAQRYGDAGERHAVAALVSVIGDDRFAHAALEALNQPVQAASWSVYRLRPGDEPLMHCSASHGVPDTTRDCFQAYRRGLYRMDRSFDPVPARPDADGVAVLHMRAEGAPSREHRDVIYRRHGLLERLSVAAREADGSLLAINLYRHEHQGPFSGVERDRLGSLAPVLLACVRRHLALAGPPPTAAAAAAAADPRAALRQACPALTARELDVCERLLRGLSHDGVAADLGLSVATVKTYRARAFERLGLHFRSELFARFGGACRPLG